MTEENHETFIPAIELLLEGMLDASDEKQEKVINAVTTAAANDGFRAALINIARNNAEGGIRKKAVKCLIKVAEGYDDALEALIDIAKHDPSKTDKSARDRARYHNTAIIASGAVVGLKKLAPKRGDALAALIDIAKNDENEDDRWLAIRCLTDLAPTQQYARVTLEGIAQDENDPLRQAAAEALKSLEEQATQETIDSLDLRQLGGLHR